MPDEPYKPTNATAAALATDAAGDEAIRLRGVRVHNLQNIDLDIPRDQLTVITGPSGSGKSSLAFDTLFAEGQRQYIETLSTYARQFLHQLERPDVDLIEGLQPTISIDQRAGSRNPRSTVATVTEIHDYLRLLMARVGEVFCYRCRAPIRQQTPEQIADELLALGDGAKLILLAPMVRGRKGKHTEVFDAIRKAGFVRARVDGTVYDLDAVPELAPRKNHTIEAVVDRLIVRANLRPRLMESLHLALRHGEDLVGVVYLPPGTSADTEWPERRYSTEYACPNCRLSYDEIEPRTFSFNSPYGACPACDGLGIVLAADAAANEAGAVDVAEAAICPECKGARLRPEARSVRLAGKAIHEITALAVGDARQFFSELRFTEAQAPVAGPIVREIASRLEFIDHVGLPYLTLDRPADTLSGGELQRIRLATGIGSGLVGVCYILDEPSIGLHPRDNQRLIEALRRLQKQGNSVLVVEHDEAIMREADHLIDVGPGAGRHGGRIVAQGTPDEVCQRPESITGKYLSGELSIPLPRERRKIDPRRAIVVEGATAHNLKNISATFPLSAFVCVTGVSGSGKSSLVQDTLARAISRRLGGTGPKPAPHASLRGVNHIDKLVEIDQSPIGRTPRSNPATYTGVFDEVRRVFATTREARLRGYRSGRFSFNIKGGRCEACQGQGVQKIEMNFLPDLYVMCGECRGARFNRATLEVHYRGLSIADVLDLRVDEAVDFFENFPAIRRLLGSLQEVGLGYLTLGQSSTTLSGGEAQRIKLATELGRVDSGKTLYILDEPTTGLHFDDIRKLLAVLARLVDLGNTVIVIEHHLDVIKSADWIIDLGPDGGQAGGYVVGTGTPEEIARLEGNATGRYLRPMLEERSEAGGQGSGFGGEGSGFRVQGSES
ncbi:MAG TPA: excinuclease ABC subunit UvrA [Pirellulales bacterium]|nr:excinuclease ABC subunit UvrA [Pirellulales bacterium]